MSTTSITFKVKVAWWVIPYLKCVAWFAYTTNMNPDIEKIMRVVLRGVKVRV